MTIRSRMSQCCVCCGSSKLSFSPAILMPFIAHRVFNWKPVSIDSTWGLKSIPEGRAFSICNSIECGSCGLLFLDIRFDDQEMARLYDDYRGPAYTQLRDNYEPGYALKSEELEREFSYIDSIEDFLSPLLQFPVSILDWGGDTGLNTPFKNKSRKIDIFDISNKQPLPGMAVVDKSEALKNSYDLIVCSHVLEHVSYPSDVLEDIRKVMKNDTILYIELPVENLMLEKTTDRLFKKRHWHEHINFFTETSLRRLVERLNLQLAKFSILEVNTASSRTFKFQLACSL
jgi:hypothetical protein